MLFQTCNYKPYSFARACGCAGTTVTAGVSHTLTKLLFFI